jgi:hypothetical protein
MNTSLKFLNSFVLYICANHKAFSHMLFLVKGTVPRDFRLQIFFKSVFPKALRISLGGFKFYRKFTENSSVSLISVANGNNLQSEKFNYFVWTPLGSRVNFKFTSGVSSLILFLWRRECVKQK